MYLERSKEGCRPGLLETSIGATIYSLDLCVTSWGCDLMPEVSYENMFMQEDQTRMKLNSMKIGGIWNAVILCTLTTP